jgi:hexosaminidase
MWHAMPCAAAANAAHAHHRACALMTLLFALATAHTPGDVCASWNKDGCFPAPDVSVWPQPRDMSVGTGAALGVPNLHFECEAGAKDIDSAGSAACDDVLTAALQRYALIIAGKPVEADRRVPAPVGLSVSSPPDLGLPLLTVRVASMGAVLNATLFPEMSEKYTLQVDATATAGTATLHAATTLGALRGLETFAQLVDFGVSPPRIHATPVAIVDAPRFPVRGLKMDTSRHYLPVRTLNATLDALAAAKMNLLNWHIVDGQSFPLQSTLFPELSARGAYCTECVYTPADVRAVVEHARMRGIRVLVEIDVPGHSGFGYGRPDVVACPTWEGFRGAGRAIDPTQDSVYDFLRSFFLETAALLPDTYIGMCGDEVHTECWNASARIREWVAARNMTFDQLEQHFWSRMNEPGGVIRSLAAVGKKVVVSEGSNPRQGSINLTKSGFPGGTIAEVWGNSALSQGVRNVLRSEPGARVIVGGPYYLDQQSPWQEPEPTDTKVAYAWSDTWKNFYTADPLADGNLTAAERARVLGGVAEEWSERLDPSSIASFIWPRALATAERLWSAGSLVLDLNVTAPRLLRASCQVLERRGVRSGPINPGFCPWSLGWD